MSLYDSMAKSHPALVVGRVRCEQCGSERRVDSAECLRTGWPKCCGYTMTLQPAIAAKDGRGYIGREDDPTFERVK